MRELHDTHAVEAFGHLWGFDSFQGLPASDLRRNSPYHAQDRGWRKGGLNAADQLRKVLGTVDAYVALKVSQ